jgi:putative ABC transport system permease protein
VVAAVSANIAELIIALVALTDTLQARPDSVLVAAETVTDFQLQPGDQLRLRLQDGRTKQFKTVTFHCAGAATGVFDPPPDVLRDV